MTPAEFETLVESALASLPKRFADLLDNVAVVVEEEPSEDDLDVLYDEDEDDDEDDDADDEHDHDHGDGRELLGLYRGIPLTQRGHDMLPRLPDTIAIFRGPILRIARSRRDAERQIRDTVIHELGHYFGLSDFDMAD